MIGVNGQWRLSASIGTIKDFLTGDQLTDFQIIERAGGELPQFEMTFSTGNKEVLYNMNEGNPLTISIGRTADNMMDYRLWILNPKIKRNGQSEYVFNLSGLAYHPSYVNDCHQQITSMMSGVQVMAGVAERNNMKFDTNLPASADKMKWIQPYTTDRAFVNSTWLRTDVGLNNVPLIGISSDSIFRFRSLKAMLSLAPSYIFTYGATAPDQKSKSVQIAIEGEYTIQLSNGLLNQFAGYGLETLEYNLDSGGSIGRSSTVSTLLAASATLGRNADVKIRRVPNSFAGDNVHARYNESYINNLNYLCSYSACTVDVSFKNEFYPVRLLDLVLFKDDELEVNNQNKQTSETYTGMYLVNMVARRIVNGSMVTRVEMSREAPAALKGNVR
ncbi:hypothetical protein Peetri_00126 [Pseudomonas phage vB_PpuM-Peetri]